MDQMNQKTKVVNFEMNQKTKMVNFRVSLEDYARLREACILAGVRNVSALARAAMHRIIDNSDNNNFAIEAQVQALRENLQKISLELDRLTRTVVISGGNNAAR